MKRVKNLRKHFERLCFQHRDKGIPNLMLYVVLANILVYIFSMATNDVTLYLALRFDRDLILRGQVWRLITFVFTGAFGYGSILMVLISSLCYFSLGRAIENSWGTFRFNLFYFTGIILLDIYAMIFGCYVDPYYLNLSLLLSYATLYPNAQFLLFFFIPVKAWIFALIDIFLIVLGLFTDSFPYNLIPIVALLNCFLFFGKDIINVFPLSWRSKLGHLFKEKTFSHTTHKEPIQFHTNRPPANTKPAYSHHCTVCGRTDVSHPDLEFRYCSRCNGYHCYCEDHISNHTHIQ